MTARDHRDADRPVLLLDVGGVLLLPDVAKVAQALAPWGAGVPDLDGTTLHYEAVRAFDSSGDVRDYRRAYARGLGLVGDRLEHAVADDSAWQRPWQVTIPSAVAALCAFVRDGGVDVAIVSDSDGTVARQLVDNGVCQVGPGPLPTVLAVCDSAVVGATKPSPLMFAAAQQAVGASRRVLGHVGDSLICDVRGASRAGIEPFHVDPLGWCTDRGHRHIDGLADLTGLR